MQKSEAAEILGVDKNAKDEDISKAFRRKSKRHHPDAGGDNEAFVKLQLAHDVLLNKNTTPDPGQAVGELLNAFRSVLGRVNNPLEVDLIARTKTVLYEQKDTLAEQLQRINTDVEKTKKILKRLKCRGDNNIIGNMLSTHIAASEAAIVDIEVRTKVLSEALLLADFYNYEADKPNTNLGGGMFTNFSFTIQG